MKNRTSRLQEILKSLPEEELDLIEKTAEGKKNVNDNTENNKARKSVKPEPQTKSEGRIGLSAVLGQKTESYHSVVDSGQSPKSPGTTENVSAKPSSVEPGVMFEKKASADVLNALYEAAGLELQKVASDSGSPDDALLKIASEAIDDMRNLEKIAEDLAEATAEKFISAITRITNG